ncbi:LOW QUALITY PROTEIN: phosphatidylinositol phosphatase PTPRQ-like [Denticeps clupeoides]|uniref:LOW QUALITY PROTEIN: phosphatidylinositol phosphatase PTPRQ-like n=1 Tax=Denticeps clupeoides TaxID=299321 RepID=UPI0010A46540|nr:LOW QUALITY PROTEIN: phosphatidylinositol phosphatase PTPRQ-like [Denticeps clupeoides]
MSSSRPLLLPLCWLLSCVQAQVPSLTPGPLYSITISVSSISARSSPISRTITNFTAPAAPTDLEGEKVGSNGILLSWKDPHDESIQSYVIQYKEVCPHPDPGFTEISRSLDIPEFLLNTLTPGSTYNIKVGSENQNGIRSFSKSLYIKTSEAPPGLVTNLTAVAENHTFVKVRWFLPVKINGLITKFAVKAKHARTGLTVQTLEVNAVDIMTGALPHCNDAADILSRGTPSPSEAFLLTSSSLPTVTLSAAPPASSWSVPISVGMSKLHPYTAYVFEVSAFTRVGEGKIASTMVRMPESAPEDPPQNLSVWNISSQSFSVSWDSPTIITGRFTYVLTLYSPTGFLYENSTVDMKFQYSVLSPYTRYVVFVQAKSAGATGPPAEMSILTGSEAPSAVSRLRAEALDSTSVRLSWKIPTQPNGPITRYRIRVLVEQTVVQDIVLRGLHEALTPAYNESQALRRRERSAGVTMVTAPSGFTLTSAAQNTDEPTDTRSTATSDLALTPSAPPTLAPWLLVSGTDATTTNTDVPPLASATDFSLPVTMATVTGNIRQTRAATTGGIEVRPASEEVVPLSVNMQYVVQNLRPFTSYNFSVSAYTPVGEGPEARTSVQTKEQVPSSVLGVSYQNLSSTSILVFWDPPLNPNGQIIHYSVYSQNLHTQQSQQYTSNTTSIQLTDLDKYTSYKLRVSASTAVGESPLSENDDMYVLTPEDAPDSPPLDVTLVNTTASTATISWKPPEKPNGIIRVYEVTYSNNSFHQWQNTSSLSATLRPLQPYTLYNVCVRAYTLHGHGNQSSEPLQVMSGEDVPGSAPYALSYESLSPSEVNVSWLPPLQPNGHIIFYRVELWNATHTLNVTTPTPHTVLSNLRKYAQYRLAVQAATRAGTGNHSSDVLNITTLEDVPSSPPQFLLARKLSDSQVLLSWRPPREANSDVLYYVVQVWNLTSEAVYNVTVPSVLVMVDSTGPYNASVSSWTRLGNGGIFNYITFTTTDSVPFDPPQEVTISDVTVTSFHISWNPPSQPNGLLQFYTIYYSDNYTINTQRVPASLLQWDVVGLSGGVAYSVWLTASTSTGDGGIQSQPVNITTLEDVPSGPVRNLTVQIFSSTVFIVSWDPPLQPNGRVFYDLRLQEAGSTHWSMNRTSNLTVTKTTTDTVYLFTKLHKFFPYIISVTPVTKAGPALNHTSTLHVRTDDDVPSSAPLAGSRRNVSSSSVWVEWFPPAEPNGVVLEYGVVLSGGGLYNSTQTPYTQLTLTDLTPYTPYNLSITTATRKGTGPALLLMLHTDEAGPMSPPRSLRIFNHTSDSLWLDWEPSVQPNGAVQHYGFRILELSAHTLSYQNSSGPATQAQLSGFKPNSVYEISVCSYTRAGNGDQYSVPVMFATNESVSDSVRNLSCWGQSWDSVTLAWEPPASPNGEIVLYMVQSGDRVEDVDPISQTHTLGGLVPDATYTVTVSPVNSAGVGEERNCTAHTLPETVPGPPDALLVLAVKPTSVTLQWRVPLRLPGLLRSYQVEVQRLQQGCEVEQETPPAISCVDDRGTLRVNVTGAAETVTLPSLQKYRAYRFRVAAHTSAGAGEFTAWVYTHTLTGDPEAPPNTVTVVPSSSGLRIQWEPPTVITGPTHYIIHINTTDGSGYSRVVVRWAEEVRTVVVGNLSAFTMYSVTVTAFTGDKESALRDGKTSEAVLIRTLEEEPKDPPKNLTLTMLPEEVTRVLVTFSPPEEPNGNISAYYVSVFRNGQLQFSISQLEIITHPNKSLSAVIGGLKGGFNYSIKIAAVNGAGFGPSSEVQLTTGIKAPRKPTHRPQPVLDRRGSIVATSRSITIHMPVCFFNDDNGPIQTIQVIVSEPAVMHYSNLSSWRSVFQQQPAPYLTDVGFAKPSCVEHEAGQALTPPTRTRLSDLNTYVIGTEDGCLSDKAEPLCNGPLKPKTHYVFKFRATNILGQFTDSEYSERVRTADDQVLTRDEQIILGVLLSFFLALLLFVIIYMSVRMRQRQKEGGTYSPREAEIIDTKFKLDQLVAVADLELKEEKISRYSSFFFRRKEIFVIQLLSYRKPLKPVNKKSFLQHVEDLCANDNARFQEEFSELPKLLQDLATSDADLPWNRSKNRFTNIKPYNNNRVKLLSEPGMPGSDYINASFVSGYLCPNEFIATQGPLPGTVADFWRMIWETRTKTVAMLTQCFEKGRIRCHQYWPEDNKPVTVFGDIVITKLTEDVYPDWTVRALRVERHGDYMVVHHFNYTSWPEHGVPESSTTLIQFVKSIRSSRGHDNTTIVVHCSAGVGRTGVFIALDHLIQHVRDHDFVDIYGLVAELRSERMCMVQNLAQYMFLYQSALDLLTCKGNSQSIWFVNYSTLEKMDSLEAMEGDVELEWEETTM